MLDEQELKEVSKLRSKGFESIKAHRQMNNTTLDEAQTAIPFAFKPALEAYERITGFQELNHIALWHHQISLYGPPCEKCGKALRTPKASKCFECGHPRATDEM